MPWRRSRCSRRRASMAVPPRGQAAQQLRTHPLQRPGLFGAGTEPALGSMRGRAVQRPLRGASARTVPVSGGDGHERPRVLLHVRCAAMHGSTTIVMPRPPRRTTTHAAATKNSGSTRPRSPACERSSALRNNAAGWSASRCPGTPQSGSSNVPAAMAGALIGGILGHQVGNGHGQDLATVGGAIAGGARSAPRSAATGARR